MFNNEDLCFGPEDSYPPLVLSIQKKLHNTWLWLKHRTIQRNHILRIPVKPGIHDIDNLMFHACFALLGRFVEEELVDNGYPQYKGYSVTRVTAGSTDEKAIDLWLWYKNARDGVSQDELAFSGEGQDKFNELVAIRTHLWT